MNLEFVTVESTESNTWYIPGYVSSYLSTVVLNAYTRIGIKPSIHAASRSVFHCILLTTYKCKM